MTASAAERKEQIIYLPSSKKDEEKMRGGLQEENKENKESKGN